MSTSHLPSRTGPDRDPDEEDLAPYEGWTFATDERGDLVMTEANRLATVNDARAVRQCLLTAIASLQGEDPLDPEFGLDRFAATNSVPHLKRELSRVLLYDSKDHERVSSVDDVSVYISGHRNAEVEIEVTLERGQLEVLTLDVGGVL